MPKQEAHGAQVPKRELALRSIPISDVSPCPGNPRTAIDEQELSRLAHAISTRGFGHPILVRAAERPGRYEVIDGERRLRAAKQAGLREIPALVQGRVSTPEEDLIDALFANGLGVALSPLEEALAYERLLAERRHTRKGIAKALHVPEARVRERLQILELPDAVRAQVASGEVPLFAVKALAKLARLHPGLPAVALTRVLSPDVNDWEAPPTFEDLVADPVLVLTGPYTDRHEDLPDDVFIVGHACPAPALGLSDEAQKRFRELCALRGSDPEHALFRLDHEDGERALALGAGARSEDGHRTLIVGRDVAATLAAESIARQLKAARSLRRERERSGTVGEIIVSHIGPAANGGCPLSPEQLEAGARRAREEDRRLRDETIAANQRLGAALVERLAKVKVDERVLKIIAAAPLCKDFSEIAARGARLCFPGWATLATRKNGSTKATYLGHFEAGSRARAYLEGARDAGEIAGRLLALLAAARWAQERHAIARSAASNYTLALGAGYSATGVPWRGEAAALLDAILLERLPRDVAAPIRDLKEREAKAAAEERRARAARAAAAKALLERAPTLTRAQRRTELERLRKGHGYAAIPRTEADALLALPEPAWQAAAPAPSTGERGRS